MPYELFARWGPPAAWMGAIWIASSRPVPEAVRPVPDELLHGAAYFVLGALALRAVAGGGGRWPGALRAAAAAGLALGWGALDELHQSFVPGRWATTEDLLADAVGVGAAALLVWWRGRAPVAVAEGGGS